MLFNHIAVLQAHSLVRVMNITTASMLLQIFLQQVFKLYWSVAVTHYFLFNEVLVECWEWPLLLYEPITASKVFLALKIVVHVGRIIKELFILCYYNYTNYLMSNGSDKYKLLSKK